LLVQYCQNYSIDISRTRKLIVAQGKLDACRARLRGAPQENALMDLKELDAKRFADYGAFSTRKAWLCSLEHGIVDSHWA